MKSSNKKILKELKNISTGFVVPNYYFKEFDNVSKKNEINAGFKIHENYFSSVEDQILRKTLVETPISSTGFKAPKIYFENINSKILDHIHFKKPSKVISIVKNNYFSIASFTIAASFLLFIGLNNYKSNTDEFNINSIELAEIESWMKDDLISFSTYEITEAFNDVSLNFEYNYTDEELLEYFSIKDIEKLILEN